MIEFEESELEEAFLNGELPVAVMMSARLDTDGVLSVTAMRCAGEIASEYIARFSDEPFSEMAKAFVCDSARSFFASHGYDYSEEASDVICEFCPADSPADSPAYCSADCPADCPADGRIPPVLDERAAVITAADCENDPVTDAFAEYENPYGFDLSCVPCAVVCVGNIIVCAAGINDYSDTDECEINVECAEEYRRHGYGRAAVLALLQLLCEAGEKAVYKTSESNAPSIRLASSCGFAERSKTLYAVGYAWSGEEDETDYI